MYIHTHIYRIADFPIGGERRPTAIQTAMTSNDSCHENANANVSRYIIGTLGQPKLTIIPFICFKVNTRKSGPRSQAHTSLLLT